MKNKRTIESLTNSVSEELAKWKVEINQVMDRVVPNLQYLRDHAADYKFLFSDAQQLVNQDAEPFQAIIKSRIADHKQAEEERLEAERQRIQKEEEEKAQREAEAKAEAERERIRKEERAKAQAEEQAKRDQEEADRLQRESEEKTRQPDPAPETIHREEKVCAANVSFENGRFKTGGKLPEESHQGRSQTMRNAEVERATSVPSVVSVHVKVTDRGCYDFKDVNGKSLADLTEEYVPDFFPGEHYGDYLILDIELSTGRILNWRAPSTEQVEEAMAV